MTSGSEEVFDANPAAGGFLGASGNAALVEIIQGRLNTMIGKSSGYVETLPPQVQARVQHLRDLQDKHDAAEEQYHKELKALQAKYTALYEPLFEERKAVVTGAKDVPAEAAAPMEGAGEPKEEKPDQDKEPVLPGIPEFWLNALRANAMVADHISAKDEEVLAHLVDVSCTEFEEEPDEDGDVMEGFKLTFAFAPNPFFEHDALVKTYFIFEQDGEPMLHRAEGTPIAWKSGKNVTVKVMKKKAKPARGGRGGGGPPKMLTKTEPCASFFNFFAPPAEPDEDAGIDEDELEELRAALEDDFELGETIRTRIIPHAVRWYTGEANEDEDDEDDEDDDEDDFDEDDDDDDDEDDDEDDEGDEEEKGRSAKSAKGAKGQRGAPEALGDKGEKPPECKQQ